MGDHGLEQTPRDHCGDLVRGVGSVMTARVDLVGDVDAGSGEGPVVELVHRVDDQGLQE
jgi:hypothetical protein